jgi:hypothetical protein
MVNAGIRGLYSTVGGAAVMTAGPLEIVEETIQSWMNGHGIWRDEEKLDVDEVQQGMLRWFGQQVEWGYIGASVLLVDIWIRGVEENQEVKCCRVIAIHN